MPSTPKIKAKPETVVRSLLEKITGRPFYNLSKLDLPKLLDDPNQLAPNLNSYINGFSTNVREIMERFEFDQQIARMAEKNLLYEVIKAFCDRSTSRPTRVTTSRWATSSRSSSGSARSSRTRRPASTSPRARSSS